MHSYHLPKKYLSWSAIELWSKSQDQFRKKYYEHQEGYASPEMNYGKHIGELLEHNDASVSHILRYSHPEHVLNFKVEDIPIIGFIDSFDPIKQRILEYKTSRVGWNQDKVDNHKQLDLYSLGVQTIYGSVTDLCHLVWMETEKCDPKQSGLISHVDSHSVRLTGNVQTFERLVTQEQRDLMRDMIVRVANEISEDYLVWKMNSKTE